MTLIKYVIILTWYFFCKFWLFSNFFRTPFYFVMSFVYFYAFQYCVSMLLTIFHISQTRMLVIIPCETFLIELTLEIHSLRIKQECYMQFNYILEPSRTGICRKFKLYKTLIHEIGYIKSNILAKNLKIIFLRVSN